MVCPSLFAVVLRAPEGRHLGAISLPLYTQWVPWPGIERVLLKCALDLKDKALGSFDCLKL